jgi:TPR repeat protein
MIRAALRVLRLLPLLAAPLVVAGCAAPFMIGGLAIPQMAISPMMETGSQAYEGNSRVELKKKAETGDHEAEYKLAETYCCRAGGPLDRISVYDNEQATQWYCSAAHAGHVLAQIRLAEIYYGRPIHGFRTIQYISEILGDPPVDMPVALMWASVAAQGDDKKAIRLHDRIDHNATPEERERASALLGEWQTAPCLWSEVIPQAKPK